MLNKLIGLAILVVITLGLEAQTKVVKGHVFAFKDAALKNIKVSAKKSKASVLTDSLGNFVIICEKKDKLIFEGAGFVSVRKGVNKEDSIIIKMKFLEGEKNEKMAIGYGHVGKDDLAHAVNNLTAYNNDFINYNDVYEIIQGRFPGVQVVSDGGYNKILIRGVNSIGLNVYALLIVDGMQVDDLSFLAPSSIKSIDVLKDGAIYGVRGGNGVVLITTLGSGE